MRRPAPLIRTTVQAWNLLVKNVKENLFGVKNRPIYTKVKNTAPARYVGDSKVGNSLVADGCVIEGTVENSILFRGVKVGKNTVIKIRLLCGYLVAIM